MATIGHSYWMDLWELDDNGLRVQQVEQFSDFYYDQLNIDFNIQKSITSNLDTATIKIYNHKVLEEMYRDKYLFFQKFNEKDYEVDLMTWRICDDTLQDNFDHIHCIFSGDLINLYPAMDGNITDQALSISCVAGKRASTRTITNKKYPAGTTYLTVVQDLMGQFVGYNQSVLDDPLFKLNKTLPKPRTFHGKTVTLLNSIATDLEMTWGFDSSPWTLAYRLATGTGTVPLPPKNMYWVDKTSVFDVAGVNGIGPHNCNGSTGKRGRIGFTKDQITFEHATDPILNIGLIVNVSDFGTMKDANDFTGRINRLNITNDSTQVEASFMDDFGNVILEQDKSNSGGFVL